MGVLLLASAMLVTGPGRALADTSNPPATGTPTLSTDYNTVTVDDDSDDTTVADAVAQDYSTVPATFTETPDVAGGGDTSAAPTVSDQFSASANVSGDDTLSLANLGDSVGGQDVVESGVETSLGEASAPFADALSTVGPAGLLAVGLGVGLKYEWDTLSKPAAVSPYNSPGSSVPLATTSNPPVGFPVHKIGGNQNGVTSEYTGAVSFAETFINDVPNYSGDFARTESGPAAATSMRYGSTGGVSTVVPDMQFDQVTKLTGSDSYPGPCTGSFSDPCANAATQLDDGTVYPNPSTTVIGYSIAGSFSAVYGQDDNYCHHTEPDGVDTYCTWTDASQTQAVTSRGRYVAAGYWDDRENCYVPSIDQTITFEQRLGPYAVGNDDDPQSQMGVGSGCQAVSSDLGSQANLVAEIVKSVSDGNILIDWRAPNSFTDKTSPYYDCQAGRETSAACLVHPTMSGTAVTAEAGSNPCLWGAHPVPALDCTVADPATWTGARTAVRQKALQSPRPSTSASTTTGPSPSVSPTSSSSPSVEPSPTVDPSTSTDPSATPSTSPQPGAAGAPAPGEDTDNCFPSGWHVFNPLNWVEQPVKCALKWAFEPDTDTLTQDQAQLTDAWNGSVVGSMTGFVTGAFGALANPPPADCHGPSVPVSAVDPVFSNAGTNYAPLDACPGSYGADVAGFAKPVITTLVLLVTGFGVYRLIMSVIGAPS